VSALLEVAANNGRRKERDFMMATEGAKKSERVKE
jgi:hypothetical protein